MANGIVIYEGPSMLDGAPIVCIATGLKAGSSNRKTGGDLIQTWILRADQNPLEACDTGADVSICGACPHRGDIIDGKNKHRSCYVSVFQAPLNIWRTWKRGGYSNTLDPREAFAGRMVRLGAYGDPAAIPMNKWDHALSLALDWTGYSHQWAAFPELARYCMASADNPADRAAAKFLGFRTFRVRAHRDPLEPGEITCPASEEAGHRTTCDRCRLCNGAPSAAKDISIIVHGAAGKVNAAKRRMAGV